MFNNMKSQKLLLLGAGQMALDYFKVLKEFSQIELTVVGRSQESAENFERTTGCKIQTGGIDAFIKNNQDCFDFAINAVGVSDLAETTIKLIESKRVKNILIEKPGGIDKGELEKVLQFSEETKTPVYIAYNRRFYSSVIVAKKIIEEDGGVSSFNFEFTEWSHIIEKELKKNEIMEKWVLGNSSHVIDLAFYLGGLPKEISCYTSGKLLWHTNASIFVGAGKSLSGALFSYQANWVAPGRWSVEILTTQHRLIFRPMEKLQIQKIGSVDLNYIDIDDALDKSFKPGLFKQVESFIKNETSNLCTLREQLSNIDIYYKMANY
jgi:predicted dehydrogenase